MAYELDHFFENPITSNVNFNTPLTSNVNLGGLDNIEADINLATPEPLETESKVDVHSNSDNIIRIPDPIKTESKVDLDIKPVALDQCLQVKFAPVPATCISQPYHQRIGFSIMGVELFGVTFSGESQTVVKPLPEKPAIAWGGQENRRHSPRHRRPAEVHHDRDGGGLRIRLTD